MCETRIYCLALFRAESEEDLEKIRGMGVPTMERAIDAYHTITASPEFREIERMREKARHDEAQALYHAKQEGIQQGILERNIEIAKNLIRLGMPLHQIAAATGLTQTEAENLCASI